MERLKEIERKIEAAVERYKKEVTEIQNSKDDVLVNKKGVGLSE